jgi:Xaa-Pro dipeptidase
VLTAGQMLTIEPGCYFVDFRLDQGLAEPELTKVFIVDRINEYRWFGGVMIEDDVIITKSGTELMNIVARTVEQIEGWMAGDYSFIAD